MINPEDPMMATPQNTASNRIFVGQRSNGGFGL
jgi:hypothetical protein